jgi:hypothetical protein
MKFFTLLLAFYLLAISLLPCSDVHNDCKNTLTQNEQQQNQDHKTTHRDICSPFCSCSCCQVVSNIPQQTIFPQLEAKFQFLAAPVFLTQSNFFHSQFLSSIWQPPRTV